MSGGAMFGRETRMLLRHYLEQGSSKSELARQLGVSRDTIHRWIRDGDLERDLDADAVRYGPRPRVATKLDAYKPIIDARLTAYPELSSVRLLDEIRGAGYAGGYSQLKAYVRRVRPLPAPEPVIRVDRRKSTSHDSDLTGACATPCSWCSATRGCCGAASSRARTWRRSSMVSR